MNATPERLYQLLVTVVFAGVLGNDAKLCDAIRAFDGAIEFRDETLHFTLPALFDFLIAQTPDWPTQDDNSLHRNYLSFRKIIYKQPTNETLGKQGGMVEIATPNENYDLTVYRLVRVEV